MDQAKDGPQNSEKSCGIEQCATPFILIKDQYSHSPDIILISIFSLFDNELSIKKDKATHDQQPQI